MITRVNLEKLSSAELKIGQNSTTKTLQSTHRVPLSILSFFLKLSEFSSVLQNQSPSVNNGQFQT